MPVDASIALGVKPMQVKSQGEYLNELYNQQNAEQTNQLNQMKMDEYKRGLSEDEAIKNALTRLDRNSPTYEQDRFNAYALKGIEGVKAYAATKKEEAAAEEHAVGTTGKKLTNVKEASAFHRDNLWGVTDPLSAVAWVENLYKDATIGSNLESMISKQQMLASIPTDPAQLANWKTQVAMGSKEFAAPEPLLETPTYLLYSNQKISTLQEFLETPASYIAVMAYLVRGNDDEIMKIRSALSKKLNKPVTFGWGPRFLHSTGQIHKGGQPNGCFIQITTDIALDLPIPNEEFTFANLLMAQALGDAAALTERNLPLIRIHLKSTQTGITDLLKEF